MELDSLLTLVADFGLGFIVWRQNETFGARPFLPVIDRQQSQICGLAERSWFAYSPAASIEVLLTFVNEFKLKGLSVEGRAMLSSRHEDILATWGAAAEARFPDGPQTPGLVALRLSPRLAQMRSFTHNSSSVWQF